MKAKIICVYDNGAKVNTSFIGAHGLSMLIDVDDQKTLFDTGMRGRYLLHNLSFMKVKPDDIDRVVISHNHRSNVGGLKSLIEARDGTLDVYVNGYFEGIKGFLGRSVGQEVESKMNLIHMDGDISLSDHLDVIGPFGDVQEFFPILRSRNGPVILSSCYHCGVDAPLDAVKERYGRQAYSMVGGIHLPKAKQKTVDPVSEAISAHGVSELHINHCATPKGIVYMRTHFGLNNVHDFFVGDSISYDL